MSLKNNLRTKNGQAVVEYFLLFTASVCALWMVFSTFNPDRLGIGSLFNAAIDTAITELARSE